jgi:ABC-type bacteriocin/lantibiotic exporter with double-glycine peptidase domain
MEKIAMNLIRRKWTPAAADEWTKEDIIAVFLSIFSYIGLTIGVVLSLLFITIGYLVLSLSVILIILMHWVIDPKLKTISQEYEKKQKHFLEELEKIERWESPNE